VRPDAEREVRVGVASDVEDYVRKAGAIATDGSYRRELSRRIGESSERIFDDPAPSAALADFLAHRGER